MKAALFDLDDTLYPEIEFVRSGFKAVVNYIHSVCNQDKNTLFVSMMDILEKNGQGKVFDIFLQKLNLYSEMMVRLLVYVYRSHRPDIKLFDETLETLRELKSHGLRLGIITDGMGSVQRRKIEALELGKFCDVIICTDEIGPEYWKPSPIPYELALNLLDIRPEFVAYIGDNIQKDFVAPNALGIKTVWVKGLRKRDHISEITHNLSHEPKYIVDSIADILPFLIGEK